MSVGVHFTMELIHDLCHFLKDTVVLLLLILLSLLEAFYRLVVPVSRKSLYGEVAVVTGAGHGIGAELARQLAHLGVSVACWDINEETVTALVEELSGLGATAVALKVDVSDENQVEDAAKKTIEEVGEVTLLFNNAGIMPCKPLLSFSASEVRSQFSVNVLSHFWTIKQFLPRMIKNQKGHIVAMSSVAGLNGAPNLTPYCSTKFAVKGLMDSLFLELRAHHRDLNPIQLTTVHPYVVTTGLAKNPSSRFMSILPYTTPKKAAELTLAAVRTNQEEAFIPSFLSPLYRMSKLWPRQAQLAVLDYLQMSFGVSED